jgi:hypothetical protein
MSFIILDEEKKKEIKESFLKKYTPKIRDFGKVLDVEIKKICEEEYLIVNVNGTKFGDELEREIKENILPKNYENLEVKVKYNKFQDF